MSVLIKGMEMPKNCDECRIMVFEDTNCVPELFCGFPIVFKAHPQGVGHRPDYCPLVEVPPHGRLIDADALKEKMKIVTRTAIQEIVEYDINAYKVDDAPTIIESEGE